MVGISHISIVLVIIAVNDVVLESRLKEPQRSFF